MKHVICLTLLALLSIIGCKEKSKTPCTTHATNILDGLWSSVDSVIVAGTSQITYQHEFLEFKQDSLFIYKVKFPRYEFTYSMNECDTLKFVYLGKPVEVLPPPGYGNNKVLFLNGVDTIEIKQFNEYFPAPVFNKFYRIE